MVQDRPASASILSLVLFHNPPPYRMADLMPLWSQHDRPIRELSLDVQKRLRAIIHRGIFITGSITFYHLSSTTVKISRSSHYLHAKLSPRPPIPRDSRDHNPDLPFWTTTKLDLRPVIMSNRKIVLDLPHQGLV